MDILECKLVAERIWLLWNWLPVLSQKRRYTTWDVPHQIILFLTFYFLFPILNNFSQYYTTYESCNSIFNTLSFEGIQSPLD